MSRRKQEIPKVNQTPANTPAETVEKDQLNEEQLDEVTGGNIGSQSSGAGAGKVTFNPFSTTRKIDLSSPK